MKTKLRFLIGVSAVCGLLFFISCQSTSNKTQTDKMESVEMVQYTCPMHPEVVQNEPGTCPECKMELVEKKVENHEGHSH